MSKSKVRKPRTKIRKCDGKANQNRLVSIDHRKNAIKLQQDLVSAGLENQKLGSKKILYSSDSESEDENLKQVKKLSMFSESDDDSSDDSYNSSTTDKTKLDSAKTKKFENLLATPIIDERFQLENINIKEPEPDEKTNIMSILADIQGKNEIFTKSQMNQFVDPSSLRYDPKSRDQKEPTVKKVKKLNKNLPKPEILQKVKSKPAPAPSDTTFMTVNSNLTDAFGKNKVKSSNSGFSFGFVEKVEAVKEPVKKLCMKNLGFSSSESESDSDDSSDMEDSKKEIDSNDSPETKIEKVIKKDDIKIEAFNDLTFSSKFVRKTDTQLEKEWCDKREMLLNIVKKRVRLIRK